VLGASVCFFFPGASPSPFPYRNRNQQSTAPMTMTEMIALLTANEQQATTPNPIQTPNHQDQEKKPPTGWGLVIDPRPQTPNSNGAHSRHQQLIRPPFYRL
jgi:hypothetical protein